MRLPGKRRWWWLSAVLLAVGLYAAVGFWVVPPLAVSQARAYVTGTLGKQLTVGRLRFNPFTFELDATDVAVRDHAGDAAPLVALRRLYVDFQVSSLWQRALVFRQVLVSGPYAQVVVRPDGTLNLASLVPPDDGTPSTPAPEVRIGDFQLDAGRVDFTDQSLPSQPRTTLAPLAFRISGLRTRAGGGRFNLQAVSGQGERLDFDGSLSLQPLASDGRFQVKALQASSVQDFLGGYLPMQLHGGSLDLTGQYHFGAVGDAQGMQLDLGLPQVRVSGLGLRARGVDEDWISLPQAVFDNIRVSLARHSVAIDALRLDRARASVQREADGSLNLMRMFAPAPAATAGTPAPVAAVPPPAATGSPSAPPAAPAAANANAPAWTFDLAQVRLTGGEVALLDRTVTPAANVRLALLDVELGAVGLDLARAVPVKLKASINRDTPLEVDGSFTPGTGAVDVQLALGRLPLKQVLPYLPAFPTLVLRSGTVEAKGRLALAGSGAPGPSLSYTGDAGIAGFDLVEKAGLRDFLSWERLDARGIAVSLGPDKVAIAQVDLRKPDARVSIAEDGNLNLVQMFSTPATAGPGTPPSAPAPGAPAAARAAPGPGTPVAAKAASGAAGFPLKVGKVTMAGGTVGFSDDSIEPNFSARIEGLHGGITGLSSTADAVADIDLAGYVINKYSPVTIRGGTRLLAYDQHTDVEMDFRNIDLSMFNPYSGRFAGYAIAKGKLTTELHYTIEDRRLQASHHVIIDQLEWGQATASKDKVSLPVRLATSLLKDRHGVIDLSLPVAGTLDDPSFRIGPIVWKIIGNIITKAVTAPFALLGSLFKGAEDAQYVDFAPGSAQLPETARDHLAALAKGLAERPEVRLDIPSGPAPQLDADGLAGQAIDAALAGQGAHGQALASLPAEDRLKALRALYRQAFGHKPEPPPPPAPEDASHAQKGALEDQAETDWLHAQLLAHFQPTPQALQALGQARAQAIQDALLSAGDLDPVRVFTNSDKAASVQAGSARVELGLQ